MKKIFTVTILLLSGIQLFGQIQQGKVLLSGTVSYLKSGDADAYELGVQGGYFVTDKTAVGAAVSIEKGTRVDLDILFFGEIESKSFGVFTRHYFNMGDESKFYFYLQPAFNFVKTSLTETDGDEFEFDTKLLSVSPGFSYYPVPKIGIELSLTGLVYQFPEGDGDGVFTLDLKPLSPTLGITFLLGN
jgi:hypothetical protein